MQKNKPSSNDTNNLTETITNNTNETAEITARFRNIQNMSQDDFVNREVRSQTNHNGSTENHTTTTTSSESTTGTNMPSQNTTTSTTTSTDATLAPNIPSTNNNEAIQQLLEQRRQLNNINFQHRATQIPTGQRAQVPQQLNTDADYEQLRGVFAEQHAHHVEGIEQANREIRTMQELDEQLRSIMHQTRQIFESITIWSWNHPFLAVGTISTLGMTIWYIFRGRAAIRLLGNLTRILGGSSIPAAQRLIENYNANLQRDQQNNNGIPNMPSWTTISQLSLVAIALRMLIRR